MCSREEDERLGEVEGYECGSSKKRTDRTTLSECLGRREKRYPCRRCGGRLREVEAAVASDKLDLKWRAETWRNVNNRCLLIR
jgi:hypothetical protein